MATYKIISKSFTCLCISILIGAVSCKAKTGKDLLKQQLVPQKKYKAYSLEKNKWLSFDVNKNIEEFKFTVNAEYVLSYEKKLYYSLDLEVLNKNGKVLLNKKYSQKFKDKAFRQAKTKRMMTNPHLVNINRYLSPDYVINIPLSNLDNPSEIKIKFNSKPSVVTGTAIRASYVNIDKSGNKKTKSVLPKNKNSDYWKEVSIGKLPKGEINKKYFNIHPPKKRDLSKIKPMFRLYLDSAVGGIYEKPSKQEIVAAEKIFTKLFKGAELKDVRDECEKINMNIKEIKKGHRVFIVVYEKETHKTGRGFYVFCRSYITRNMVIDFPHRFYDRKTGLIGYKLILSGYFTACAWNTVNRYQTPSHVEGSSDMSHTKESIFFSFTKAFAKAMPENSILIQLHGFRSKWHRDGKVYFSIPYDIVLSSGTDKPDKHFFKYADEIKKAAESKVAVIPEQNIPQLAATTNPEVGVLKKAGKNQVFMHMELSDKVRKTLLKDLDKKRSLIKTLNEVSTKYITLKK